MKNKILFFLEKECGSFVSGAEIAKKLGISRMAVCKEIKALRELGLEIQSSPKNGYRLTHPSDILCRESVSAHLPNGRHIDVFCYDCVRSTNEIAKQMAASASHGTLIAANEQTNGRGRYGRSFFSPAGSGIYMSVIIKPSCLREGVMYTVAAAVAARKVIQSISEEPAKIKWVNDIYIGERKVCGILCEAVSELETGELCAVICGIGINITAPEGGFPDEIKDKASAVTKQKISRARLAADITDTLLTVLEGDDESLIREYTQHMMLIDREIYYRKNNTLQSGTVTGIDGTGGLIVKSGEDTEILRSGEVQLERF